MRAAVGRQTVLTLLGEAGPTGLTWREFDEGSGWRHHGRSTGALAALHRQGLLARLAEKRERCSVYVLVEHVEGRETVPYGSGGSRKPAGRVVVAGLEARNQRMFDAMDDLVHAAGFKNHKHLYVNDADRCFLCVARGVVAEERRLRNKAQADGRAQADDKVQADAGVTGLQPAPDRAAS